jgi:membrane dipeptidase
LKRRNLLFSAALLPALARAQPQQGFAPYDRAIVIDALGGPGEAADSNSKLSAKALRDALDSGVTACNQTVGYNPSWDDCIAGIAGAQAEIDAHPDVLLQVKHGADLKAAKQSRRVGIIYGVQNLAMIGSDLGKLTVLHDLGVRITQLTYNVRNLIGDGCLEPGDAGLSRFGREVVAKISELRLVLDLSHVGYRTIRESIAAARLPPVISHTGCAAVVKHPRHVPDDLLRDLSRKGGVAGIFFMPYLREHGQPMAEDVVRHLEHAIDVAGEDHVGLGTDGSLSALTVTAETRKAHRENVEDRKRMGIGAPNEDPEVLNYVPDLNTPRRFETLALLLSKRGHKDARLEKILGGNFARVFSETWG